MRDASFLARIHGREGQGATTSAQLLAGAAIREGVGAQVVRSFGRERTGAPVEAFCRIGGSPISGRPDVEVDALIIQDAALLHLPHVLRAVRPEGFVLVNARTLEHRGLRRLEGELPDGHLVAVAAHGRHFPNTAMLGALVALTGVITLDSLTAAIRARFRPDVAEAAVDAARRSFAELARTPVRPAV